jgi:hypothetical protein
VESCFSSSEAFLLGRQRSDAKSQKYSSSRQERNRKASNCVPETFGKLTGMRQGNRTCGKPLDKVEDVFWCLGGGWEQDKNSSTKRCEWEPEV